MRPFPRHPGSRPARFRLRRLAIAAIAAAAAHADPLDTLLDSGALAADDNPVAATFFAEQAAGRLPSDVAVRATEQLKASLRRQTDPFALMMGSLANMGGGKATQQVSDEAQRQGNKTRMAANLLAGMAGVGEAGQQSATQRQVQGMRQETIQSATAPWIRGVEAARAMERLGDAQSAGRFYMNCIQMMPSDWMKDAALNGILAMGPRRSFILLSWMADNAEQISLMAVMGQAQGRPPQGRRARAEPEMGTVAVRGAALRGLGTVVGTAPLTAEQRAGALACLRRYANGGENAPYYADAATGLGRTRDPAAVADLQRLAGWRKDPHVAEAAEAALAIGFHDPAAAGRLRRVLHSRNPDDVLHVLPWLLEAGDPETLAWAVQAVTAHRAAEDVTPDLRPQIVRELAEMPGGRGRAPLEQIAAEGAGNDWLQAWVAVALLELGDRARLPAVLAAVNKTDWTLDHVGLKYYWSRIRPVVSLVASAALGAPVSPRQIAQLVGNMAADELARARGNADDRELMSVQLRWQAGAALGGVDDPAAAAMLLRLLDDQEPSVRLNAATALALSPNPGALAGIVRGMAVDFGGEGGPAAAAAIRSALLRSAVLRFPRDPRTRQLCQAAAGDDDAGVRFIADAALRLL